MSSVRAILVLLLATILVADLGCERNGSTPSATSQSSAQPAYRAPRRGRVRRGPVKPLAQASAAASAPAPAKAGDAAPEVVTPPPLVGPDGAPLGQTEAEPSASSAFFRHQAELLFRAIVQDDPDIAKSVFFPLVAYRQVKAIADPDRDWNRRLIAAFERDIHEYHAKLGKNPEAARFVELYVPEGGARWMKPGSEGNKLGYFRVLRSQLRYLDADGKEQRLEITSLISWRGEWYVVHVHGFK